MATNWNLSFPCLRINRAVTLRERTLKSSRRRTNPNPTCNDSTKPHVQTRTPYHSIESDTMWYSMVQDGTVQQRLKHQIVESKTKHGKLTKII